MPELYKIVFAGQVSDRILGLAAAEATAADMVRAAGGSAAAEVWSESHADAVSRVTHIGGPFKSVRVDRFHHA